MRNWLAALVLCCAANNTLAAQQITPSEQVISVQTDGSVELSSSGRAVFKNLLLPDAKLAENWLSAHLLQQRIAVDSSNVDRYARKQIISGQEAEMLRAGVAMIYASDGEIPANWQAAEAAARNAKTGIWASGEVLLAAENMADHLGEFHLVEGTVQAIYESKSATYLNFGKDWHDDFSITIPAKARRSMKPLLQQIKVGDRLRVRGGITQENGPMIKLLHAENLEKI